MPKSNVITKSIRLKPEEEQALRRISRAKGLSESTLVKRFVMEGIARYRLEQAIAAYSRGEADLEAAARHAGISVHQMMTELERRDVMPAAASAKFRDGLRTLAETFGGSEALFQTIAELDQKAEARP